MKEVIIDDEEQYLVLLSGDDKEVKKDIQDILKEDKKKVDFDEKLYKKEMKKLLKKYKGCKVCGVKKGLVIHYSLKERETIPLCQKHHQEEHLEEKKLKL